MGQFLLVAAVALTVGAIVFGIAVLVTGDDRGLRPVEPDGRAVPLPSDRPLAEPDLARVRFDTTLRGYRMAQVDAALARASYDIGYKDELIKVLQAEVDALRQGRLPDAEVLRRAREAALQVEPPAEVPLGDEPMEVPLGDEPMAASDEPAVASDEPAAASDAPAVSDPEPVARPGSAVSGPQ